ncbi:MAG: hypothetical protein M3Y13_07335, partial [Armatimonadota bacterium]|nr:hypothetical protein [Armatimonadota bacterium]
MRKLLAALALVMVLALPGLVPKTSAAADLDWQPRHTWVFAVGTLSWKHKELFDSFPTENRRDAELVDLFRQRGVPDDQIVYLQDKHATQAAIDSAFAAMLPKLGADDL